MKSSNFPPLNRLQISQNNLHRLMELRTRKPPCRIATTERFSAVWTNRNAGRTPALRFRLTALFSSSRFPENWYADKIHLPLCTIQFASTFFILSDRGLHFVASTDSKKSPASFPFGLPAGDFHFSAEAPSVHRPQGRKPTLQLQPTKVCFQVFRGLFPAQ